MYSDINPQIPCTGRAPKLKDHDKRYLGRLSDAHPRATARDLLHESRLDIGVSTLGHHLRSLQRRVFLARRKPWIGPHNRRQRDGVDYGPSGRFQFGGSIVIPMKYIFKLLLERLTDEKCDDFPEPMPPMI